MWLGPRLYWNETLLVMAVVVTGLPLAAALGVAWLTEPWSAGGVAARLVVLFIVGYLLRQAASGVYLGRRRLYGLWRGQVLTRIDRTAVVGIEVGPQRVDALSANRAPGYAGPSLGSCWVPHVQRRGVRPLAVWSLARPVGTGGTGREALTSRTVERVSAWAGAQRTSPDETRASAPRRD